MKTSTPGQSFERQIQLVCDAYRAQGRADIRKVDPPTKTFGFGGNTKTILLANPWLDFMGCWTENCGRTIMLEAKATSEPRLSLLAAGQRGGGISHNQLTTAKTWAKAGAAVAFLWHHESRVKIVTPAMVEAATACRKSIRWCDAHSCHAGTGFVFFDFLSLLQPIHP